MSVHAGAREVLLTERARALERLAALDADVARIVEASADDNADDEHDPEGATIAFERSYVASLAVRTRRRVAEVDAALARLEAGTYGTCEACGLPIPAERLAARPTASAHVTCPAAPGPAAPDPAPRGRAAPGPASGSGGR